MTELPYACGTPFSQATLKHCAEDFQVNELLGFEPSGEGEHTLLCIQKRGQNTDWVTRQLAKFAQVKPVAIGYCGLKDRHAVTSQWFSIQLAGDLNWSEFETDDIKILDINRHRRKLNTHALSGNQFQLRLRDVQTDWQRLPQHLDTLANQGVPNYFGEQRFGHNRQNLVKASQLLTQQRKFKRHQRSIYLSAVRSELFNQILAQRVIDKTWDQALPGDIMMLDGSHSYFNIGESVTDDIQHRLQQHDIHPTSVLYGTDDTPPPTYQAQQLEHSILRQHPIWCDGLIQQGIKQHRRSLRLIPQQWQWRRLENNMLALQFTLPAGAYATSVIRELTKY